ncbi:MAG: ssk1 response regulator receiver [Trizodia sp. TS-e1964]|nr:MAG: ssk1 response regulator receiver [Trizodia sp. TS-e1964]
MDLRSRLSNVRTRFLRRSSGLSTSSASSAGQMDDSAAASPSMGGVLSLPPSPYTPAASDGAAAADFFSSGSRSLRVGQEGSRETDGLSSTTATSMEHHGNQSADLPSAAPSPATDRPSTASNVHLLSAAEAGQRTESAKAIDNADPNSPFASPSPLEKLHAEGSSSSTVKAPLSASARKALAEEAAVEAAETNSQQAAVAGGTASTSSETPLAEVADIPAATATAAAAATAATAASNPTAETTRSAAGRPNHDLVRRQSLLPHTQTRLIRTLLDTEIATPTHEGHLDYIAAGGASNRVLSANMVIRKIWVKRPGASATLVSIHEDDLVDDVREMILKKYANSLGRNFDAPDVSLRICPRETSQRASRDGERTLGPEEPIGRTLDAYFPGGQTVDEALVIDVPRQRTPKPSPRAGHIPYYLEEVRPGEGGDYFTPLPTIPATHISASSLANQHSIAVLNTGQVPTLPSPGSRTTRHRPRGAGRTHTASPTQLTSAPPILGGGVGSASNDSKPQSIPPAPPLPTPPAPAPGQDLTLAINSRTATPPRVASPRPAKSNTRRRMNKNGEVLQLPSGLLDGAVPPINVLIVEDNIINLKLLEAFMKRLKVRWQTAMNGREAVTKWRAGGFHLVLMDIQLPVMNGLEATKEIRRLEKVNNIGVFSSSASSSAPDWPEGEGPQGADQLPNTQLFRSPVIIPVNFVWLERKVMEWGCMQALIDFDGWRKWKDFSAQAQPEAGAKSGPVKKIGGHRKERGARNSLSMSIREGEGGGGAGGS